MTIGSDVEPAARGDMFTAMRVTLQHERNRAIMETFAGRQPAGKLPITCRHALEWTTVNGARVAGLDRRVGSLTPGKQADVMLLRGGDLNMFPVRDPIGSVVMQGGVANVDTVLIAGRVMKRNGALLYPISQPRRRRSRARAIESCAISAALRNARRSATDGRNGRTAASNVGDVMGAFARSFPRALR